MNNNVERTFKRDLTLSLACREIHKGKRIAVHIDTDQLQICKGCGQYEIVMEATTQKKGKGTQFTTRMANELGAISCLVVHEPEDYNREQPIVFRQTNKGRFQEETMTWASWIKWCENIHDDHVSDNPKYFRKKCPNPPKSEK